MDKIPAQNYLYILQSIEKLNALVPTLSDKLKDIEEKCNDNFKIITELQKLNYEQSLNLKTYEKLVESLGIEIKSCSDNIIITKQSILSEVAQKIQNDGKMNYLKLLLVIVGVVAFIVSEGKIPFPPL